MDKEKQVVSCETCNHKKVCYDLLTNKDYNFKGYGCLRYCRDLTKDSIVISNEEYEKIWKKGYEEGYSILVDDTIKKTAEKILNEFDALQENLSKKITQLKEPFSRYMNSKEKEGYEKAILSAKSIVTSFKSRLAKQFGVDLGEKL